MHLVVSLKIMPPLSYWSGVLSVSPAKWGLPLSHLRFLSWPRPYTPASPGAVPLAFTQRTKHLTGTKTSSLRQPHLTQHNGMEVTPHIPRFPPHCCHQLLQPVPFPWKSSLFLSPVCQVHSEQSPAVAMPSPLICAMACYSVRRRPTLSTAC